MLKFPKLQGRIIEVYGTRGAFAKAMKTSAQTISAKLAGKIEWRADEMALAARLLAFEKKEIPEYFFPD